MHIVKIALFALLIAPQAIIASAPKRQSMNNEQTRDFSHLSRTEQLTSGCCCVCCAVPALIATSEKFDNTLNKGRTLTLHTVTQINTLLHKKLKSE